MPELTIARLADEGGVGVETIRYYQRRGLLMEPSRPAGGVRRYGVEDVRRLRFIRSAQAAGFTLEEISELIALDATEDRPRVREMARERIRQLDAKIAHLKAVRASLDKLATVCGAGTSGPCPILTSFDHSPT